MTLPKNIMRLLLLVLFGAQSAALMAQGQVPDSQAGEDWIDLADEPSRADLFAAYEVPRDLKGHSTIGTKAFDLRGPFLFPTNALRDGPIARKDSIFGIDISHHNGNSLDFSALRQQHVRFVYMKATQGKRFRDPMFASNWKAAGDLQGASRIHRGAYHFLSADVDPTQQAESFLKILQKSGGLERTDMPPVVDLEWDMPTKDKDGWSKYSPDEIIAKTLTWLQVVKARTGRTPFVYTSHAWWQERGIPEAHFEKLKGYGLWIANYSESRRATERPTTPNDAKWHLWQFTDRARLSAGYPEERGVDANIFKGTEDEFKAAFELKE